MPILRQDTIEEFHNYIQGKLREKFPDWNTNFDPKRFKEFPNPHNFWAFTKDLEPNTPISSISKRIGNLLVACIEHQVVVKIKLDGKVVNLTDEGIIETIKKKTFDKIRTEDRKSIFNLLGGDFRRAIDTIRLWPSYNSGDVIIGTFSWILLYSCLNRKASPIIFPSSKSKAE